jgi:hypothetical protein
MVDMKFIDTLKVAMVDIENQLERLQRSQKHHVIEQGGYTEYEQGYHDIQKKIDFLEEQMDSLDSLIYEAEKGAKKFE